MVKKSSHSGGKGVSKRTPTVTHAPKSRQKEARRPNRNSPPAIHGRGQAPASSQRGKQFPKTSQTCPVAGACGGCTHIEMPYADQLNLKNARVTALFAHEALAGAEVRPIIGMEDPFRYRNKVTSPFAPGKRGPQGGREILTGMYAPRSHRIIATENCLLENERAQQVIKSIAAIMRKHGIAPYDEDRATGFMRHAVVRVGHESDEVLVTLVTNDEAFPSAKSFCRELIKRCPFVTSIVHNINTRQTNVILGEREQRLYGPGFILDTLCGLSFRISSRSFYQVNSTQTTVLYEQAIALANLSSTQSALDAYCGTGTIGLVAAKRGAGRVIGVDSVESAIRDARENARHNGIENARFVTADASAFARELAEAGERIDVVFMDPPRAGSTEEFLSSITALAPARIIYISCNPETQVRDLSYLADQGFRPRVVQPVDMFPHTDHIETVVLMLNGKEFEDHV